MLGRSWILFTRQNIMLRKCNMQRTLNILKKAFNGMARSIKRILRYKTARILGGVLLILLSDFYVKLFLKPILSVALALLLNADLALQVRPNVTDYTNIPPPQGPGYRILLWTSFFEQEHWWYDRKSHRTSMLHQCEYSDCVLTNDRRQLSQSHLVLFHIFSLPNGLYDIPASHPSWQRWVFVSAESPFHALELQRMDDFAQFDSIFDLTMTYQPQSDIVIQYGAYMSHMSQARHDITVYSEQKSHLVLWYSSNCDSKGGIKRLKLVQELQRYIAVDQYGACGKPDPCAKKPLCSKRLQSKYKFYLAIENSRCQNYITEKFWNALNSSMVPVVYGASFEDYSKVAPPNSFIHWDNFSSVESLAEYLHFLNRHNDEYNKYLDWRTKNIVVVRQWAPQQVLPPVMSDICTLCSVAHKNVSQTHKKYKISDWFSVNKRCMEYTT